MGVLERTETVERTTKGAMRIHKLPELRGITQSTHCTRRW